MNDRELFKLAKEVINKFRPLYGYYKIGMYCEREGKIIKIISGQFMGLYGVSNHWYWKEVLPDGNLSEETFNGYGGSDDALSEQDALKKAASK